MVSVIIIAGCTSIETKDAMNINEAEKIAGINKTETKLEQDFIDNTSLAINTPSNINTSSATNTSIIDENYCNDPTGCVPAQCCHPRYLVDKNYAPDCSGTRSICTADCGSFLDCRSWIPLCVNNTCGYKIGEREFIKKMNIVGCNGCTNSSEVYAFPREIESELLENEYNLEDFTMWVNGTMHEVHFKFTEKGYEAFNKLNLSVFGVVYNYTK